MLADGRHRSIWRFVTARVLERAVAINEINFYWLKARMLTDGHQSSKRRFVTARVIRRAVAINEINFYWLKARMLADGRHRSIWRFVTARVIRRAVAISEMTFKQVLKKTWYKKDIPSANFKINKGDCFWAHNSSGRAVDLAQNELMPPPVEHDLNLIWHCTCALFFKIDCWLHWPTTI